MLWLESPMFYERKKLWAEMSFRGQHFKLGGLITTAVSGLRF